GGRHATRRPAGRVVVGAAPRARVSRRIARADAVAGGATGAAATGQARTPWSATTRPPRSTVRPPGRSMTAAVTVSPGTRTTSPGQPGPRPRPGASRQGPAG